PQQFGFLNIWYGHYSILRLPNLITVSAARLFHGASAPEYDPKQADLLPRRPASWQVQRPKIRDHVVWQNVGRICCRQQFPQGLQSRDARTTLDVWQRHSDSPARPSTLTGIAIAASPAIAESAPLSLRPSLVHGERPTAQILSVQSCHRFFGFFVVRH